MALNVTRIDVWVASIEDRSGGVAEKTAPLAGAGAQLEFALARRAPDKPGTGVLFVSPVKGARQIKAAKAVGFHKSESIYALRIEGPDKPGLGAKITQALAGRSINLRGLSAAVIGRRFVVHLALDSSSDATKAARVLRQMS